MRTNFRLLYFHREDTSGLLGVFFFCIIYRINVDLCIAEGSSPPPIAELPECDIVATWDYAPWVEITAQYPVASTLTIEVRIRSGLHSTTYTETLPQGETTLRIYTYLDSIDMAFPKTITPSEDGVYRYNGVARFPQ